MKPIIILCAGPSIKYLVSNINSFVDIDIPYVSINGYQNVYEDTFGSINKLPKYVSVYADNAYFLDRKTEELFDKNGVVFLTGKTSYSTKIEKRVNCVTLDPDVDKDNPLAHTNSMVKLIVYLAAIGYDTIFIYGCDGHKTDGSTHYNNNKEVQTPLRIRDTKDINNRMLGIMKDYGVSPKVYNCCPTSNVNCFDKITVEESIRIMKNGL